MTMNDRFGATPSQLGVRPSAELAQRLLAVVPSAKVLLMSAYKVAEIAASGHPFLAKPFTPDVLVGKVRQVLRDEPSPFARRPPRPQ